MKTGLDTFIIIYYDGNQLVGSKLIGTVEDVNRFKTLLVEGGGSINAVIDYNKITLAILEGDEDYVEGTILFDFPEIILNSKSGYIVKEG